MTAGVWCTPVLGAQSPTTYKMLNAVSKKEEYYADPLFRFLWLVASTIGMPCLASVLLFCRS